MGEKWNERPIFPGDIPSRLLLSGLSTLSQGGGVTGGYPLFFVYLHTAGNCWKQHRILIQTGIAEKVFVAACMVGLTAVVGNRQ